MFSKEPGTDEVNAFFGVSEKVDGKWQTTQRFDTLEGYLDSVSVGEFIYKDEAKKTLKLVFIDESGERVQVESTFTLLAYNVINTLAGADFTKKLKLKLYVRNRKDNGERQASIFIECGGEKASWAYGVDELPKVTRVMVGKKEVVDDTEVVEFYERVVNTIIIPRLGQEKAAQPKQEAAATQDTGVTESNLAKEIPMKTPRSFPSEKDKALLNKLGKQQEEATPNTSTNEEDDDLPF